MNSGLEDLMQICSVLNSKEKQFILSFFTASGRTEDKRVQLLQLIFNNPEISTAEACSALYQTKSSSAFRKLKVNVKRDLLNVLMIRESSHKQKAPYRQAELECRKMLTQGDILLKRGAVESGIRLLKKARKIAIEAELVVERLQIEDILRTYSGYQHGLKAFESFSESIHSQLELLNFINEAKESNYRILLPHSFQRNLGPEHIGYAKKSYERLGQMYRDTKSPNIGYYYYLNGLYYFDLVEDADESIQCAKKFLDLILEEPAVYSETRRANAHLQVANILMMQYSFPEALAHAEQAVENFTPGRNNQLTALGILFYTQLRNGMFIEAERTIELARKHPRFKAVDQTADKWAFFESALLFSKNEFEKSLEKMQKISTLLTDSAGWLLGFKLLELLNLIELQSHDLVEYRLETLRKLIQRQRSVKLSRFKLIHQVMSRFLKSGLNPAILNEERKALDLLSQRRGEFAWKPIGFELIPFHLWLHSTSVSKQKQ